MYKTLIVSILLVAVVIGGFYYLSKSSKKSTTLHQPQAEQEINESEKPLYGHVHALFRVPTDGSFLLGTHKGLFKSFDQGKTFSKAPVKGIDSNLEFMNFAYDSQNQILYAGGHGLGIVKSIDNGATWEKADSGVEGNDIHALTINPVDPNRLLAYSVGHGDFGTKDGAKTWYRIDDGPANPNVTAFGYMATLTRMDQSMKKTSATPDIGYIWAGTGGGLYSSFLCFCGWTKNTGISSSNTIYSIAPDPVHRSTMLVGTSDGMYKTTDEGKNFIKLNTSIKNVISISFDVLNPNDVFAITSNGILYESKDGGNAWKKVS